MQEKHPIKYFAPSWPALVMGTGGLGNILWKWQQNFLPARYGAILLAAIALVSYVIITIIWLIRWARYTGYAVRDLHDPIASNFYVTTGISTVIIATNVSNIWSTWMKPSQVYGVCLTLWIISCLIVVLCTFYITSRHYLAHRAYDPQMINVAWLMAPIANMAVQLAGCPVFNMSLEFAPDLSLTIFVVNTLFFGSGFFLFIFVSAFVHSRFVMAQISSPATTPTFGIFLSAVGLASGTLHDLGENAVSLHLLSSADLIYLLSTAIWGFGLWIIGIILIVCIYHAKHEGMPFKLSWWAFTFPLAAYTIAGLKVSAAYPCALTFGLALLLTILLAVLWVYIFANTLIGIGNGSLFLGTPLMRDTEDT